MRILLIEDHLPLAENIGEYLGARGLIVDYAYDGAMGASLGVRQEYDLLVLDISLPKLDGLALARYLRVEQGVTTPILMLTARDTLDDKLSGFKAGGDDYLTKPFELAELEVRIHALLRRGRGVAPVLRWGVLTLNAATHEVTRDGSKIRVTPSARRILELLMRRAPAVVSREELMAVVWGDEPPESDTALRVHLHALRSAIDTTGARSVVETLPGIGCRLIDEHDA